MTIIVAFLVIEIVPIMFVLDWTFMEIFVVRAFPLTTTEPLFEQQTQNQSYLSMASNREAQMNTPSYFGQDFKSGMSSSQVDPDAYKSDSIRAFNESFTRASREKLGILDQFNTLFSEGFISSEKDFYLYEQFSKGGKKRGLGVLYRVKTLDEESQISFQMLCRVVKFQRVKSYVIEEIFKEASSLKHLDNRYLLPINGMCFND
mmetsp:Transcript_3066/g.2048  ORF Transcript_3066/g.2048 Transcript_3066/m.2048 type:complete len:204 (-) Transcript_3066:355-966(-)